MSITAVVENDTIKLPPGVHLPDGTRVEIVTPAEPATPLNPAPENPHAWMLDFAGTVEGPADLAENHDHYIHGAPKNDPK